MGFEQYEKQKSSIFSNLMGSFGKNRMIRLLLFSRKIARMGRQDIVLPKFGTVGTIEKTEKLYFRLIFSQLAKKWGITSGLSH